MTRWRLKRMLQRVMLGMLAVGGMQQVRAQGSATGAVQAPGEPLTLYAVKYGESAYPAVRLIKGDTSGKNLTIAWMFYAVKAGREIVLIDTGFSDTNEASRSGVTLLPYQPALAAVGITPETVTHVVLTHTHSDHAANVSLYPKATVIVNRREEGSAFLKTVGRDRLVTFDASYPVMPGMTVRRVGGHTAGSSVVELAVCGKTYLLAGDEAYLPENLSKLIPVGSAVDVNANLKFLTMAKNSGAVVLTLHDPAVVKAGCVRQIAP
ncbi:MAG TPA: MBL fold metallo-hydrolase [Kiritimatiellia bacterium]|nr:MBL fold metallo-hydrolase [Kiritimatiellia bacterium]